MKISLIPATKKALLVVIVLFLEIAAASLELAVAAHGSDAITESGAGITPKFDDIYGTQESRVLQLTLEVKRAEWAELMVGFEDWLRWWGPMYCGLWRQDCTDGMLDAGTHGHARRPLGRC